MKFAVAALTIALFALFFGCNQPNESNTDNNQAMTKPVENIIPTDNQKNRRHASEAFCEAHNIPIYANLNSLFIDSDEDVLVRTKDQIIDRALALCFIELRSENADRLALANFEKRYGIMPKLSDKERSFILSDDPTEQEMADANWRAEGTHVMLWALGYVDELAYPSTFCDVAEDVTKIFSKTEQQFRDEATLRTKKEILDQADLILRLNWACVNARVKNQAPPGDLDSSVVRERHYALNWLINYLKQDWDNVTTDT